MSWLTALGSALLGGITSNIANKAAIKNQENAENNALNITNQNTARAQGQLGSFWSRNPFNKLQPVQGPQMAGGAGAPTMGIGGPGLIQALMLASGQPQGQQMPQQPPQQAQPFAMPQAPPQQPDVRHILASMYGVR